MRPLEERFMEQGRFNTPDTTDDDYNPTAGTLTTDSLRLLRNSLSKEKEFADEAAKFAKDHDLLDDGLITMEELKSAAKNFCMTFKESEAVKYMMDKFELISEQSNDQLFNDEGITAKDLSEHSKRLAVGKGARDTTWDFFTDAIRFVTR